MTNPDPKIIQTVIITLDDGRKAYYSGPVQINPGDRYSPFDSIKIMDRPLPPGCSFEEIKREEDLNAPASEPEDGVD